MGAHKWLAEKAGTPEEMDWCEFDPAPPGQGEIQIEQAAVGVNMIDTYVISGAYAIDPYPLTPGVEGAGTVIAIGESVEGFSVGDRVAYGGPPLGAYSTVRNMWPGYAVKIPDWLKFEDAAAIMISGPTAQMMVKRVYNVIAGTKVLVHAAAGSTGDSLVRWCAHLGAEVFGTVGSEDKANRAKAAGCAHVINYNQGNFADQILDLTDARGIDVVYDGIGKDTFDDSMRSLTPIGMFVTFGQASGPLPPIDLSVVPVTYSNFIARPSVFAFNAERDTYVESMTDVFGVLEKGVLDATPGHIYPLKDAPQALSDLMNRKTAGSIVYSI
jgi:NADPH:quinone reductase